MSKSFDPQTSKSPGNRGISRISYSEAEDNAVSIYFHEKSDNGVTNNQASYKGPNEV